MDTNHDHFTRHRHTGPEAEPDKMFQTRQGRRAGETRSRTAEQQHSEEQRARERGSGTHSPPVQLTIWLERSLVAIIVAEIALVVGASLTGSAAGLFREWVAGIGLTATAAVAAGRVVAACWTRKLSSP